MLIRFRVANYRSICDEQELSFLAAPLKEPAERVVHLEKYGIDVLRSIGIYGANASGKSTILSALEFMRKAVIFSQRSWEPDGGVPQQPFLLNSKKQSEPSFFEVDILVDAQRYTYGFVIDSKTILEEWLYAYPQVNKQSWFVRDISHSREYTFSRFLTGENKAIQSLTRSNSLFLSAAAQNNHKLLTPIFNWFSNFLQFFNEGSREHSEGRAAEKYRSSKYQTAMLEIIRGADLGITGIEIEEKNVPEMSKKVFEVLFADDPDFLKKVLARQSFVTPSLRHHMGDDDTDVPFPFSSESRGTQVLFCIAGDVVESLTKGGLLCVDELDASLHPLMAIEIVKMFNDSTTNPHNAQLLFNTHDINLLECGDLRRDQIWFTEKDKAGATHLYALTDYKPRKEENIRRGYLQGRYGGVPFVRTRRILRPQEHNGKS